MKRSQLAINSVSTRQAGLAECLAAYQEAGFVNVEFRLAHVKDYLAQGRRRAAVRRLLDDHGLRCIGGFETPLLAFAPPAERDQNHALIVENAELIAELGGAVLVVGTDGPAVGTAPADPLGELAAAFATVAQRIAGTGVSLAIEFNWSPLVKSLRTAAEVARRAGVPNVGVLFDPAHYHCTPTKFAELNAANIACITHVHVDDMRDKPGELSHANSDRVLPGQGCLDLRALFTQIERHGYTGYFSIELFNEALWAMPARQAARLMYDSLVPLCTAE
ncbi:MAG: sugar phosphate isomerase/epimerase family protein [Thermomicrobiales bacterium]|nr:sugar phosphate isomerase/epimerase [Thermomicrobiales bacterium]